MECQNLLILGRCVGIRKTDVKLLFMNWSLLCLHGTKFHFQNLVCPVSDVSYPDDDVVESVLSNRPFRQKHMHPTCLPNSFLNCLPVKQYRKKLMEELITIPSLATANASSTNLKLT